MGSTSHSTVSENKQPWLCNSKSAGTKQDLSGPREVPNVRINKKWNGKEERSQNVEMQHRIATKTSWISTLIPGDRILQMSSSTNMFRVWMLPPSTE